MDPQISRAPTKLTILSYNTLIQKQPYTNRVLRDMSINVAYYAYKERKQDLVINMLSASPDVICLQEIRHVNCRTSPNFYDFLGLLQMHGFQGVFLKRNIGGEFGEQGLAVFYLRDRFGLVETQVLDFNDGTGRNAMAVTLREYQHGCIFRVANTHLAYTSQMDQAAQKVKLLGNWQYLNNPNTPTFLTGDFNLSQHHPTHSMILSTLNPTFYDSHKSQNCKSNSYNIHISPQNQSNSMLPQILSTRIDYIFASHNIKCIHADVLGQVNNLNYSHPSDHEPVVACFQVQGAMATVKQDLGKLRDLFRQVRTRDYEASYKFREFLDLFWLMPQTIKNAVYQLTYKKALKLGLYQHNLQFGRIAFINNTIHEECLLDEEGNIKPIYWQKVKPDLMPPDTILQILIIIEERVTIIPELIELVGQGKLREMLEIFDERLHEETCHRVYGEVYELAKRAGKDTNHLDYGRVSFRDEVGWTVENTIKIEALKKMLLP